MKSRFFLFIGAMILLVVIIAAASLSSSGSRTTPGTYGKTLTCTLNAEVGIVAFTVTNQKTGAIWQVLPTWLPYSFNFTSGDSLTFQATAKEGFLFNVWMPNSGFPQSDNPYTVTAASAPFSLVAQFIPDKEYQP